MNDQSIEFEEYFTIGQSIRIALIAESGNRPEIPARVSRLSGDLLEIKVHEEWPADSSSLESGYLVELRSAHLGSAFRCRALLVSNIDDMTLSVRLVGSVIFEELREFFRIDTYLPLRYIPLPDKDDKTVLRLWMELADSQGERTGNTSGFVFTGKIGTAASKYSPDAIPLEYTTPVAANISGGGVRTNLPEHLPPGCKAILELYLPGNPPKIIDVIGEVLSSAYVHSEDGGKTFPTPFKFLHLPEQDRDLIISHIHAVQQRQIRQITEEMPQSYQSAESDQPANRTRKIIIRIVSTILAIAVSAILFNIYKNRSKSEVADIFEKGIKGYIEKVSPAKR